MAGQNSDGEIVLSLDIPKTVSQINSDISKLQNQLKQVQMTGGIDSAATVKKINSQISAIQSQLKQIELKADASKLIDANQLKTQGTNVGKAVAGQIEQGLSNGLSNSEKILNNFRNALSRIGMDSGNIDIVAQRIQNLDFKIESLNQSMSTINGRKGQKNVLNVAISGTDKLGNAVKLVQQYDADTASLIKNIDNVSASAQKANNQLETLQAQQIKRQSALRNQVNQIFNSAIDPNASRSITDDSHITELRNKYNEITSAIQGMGSTSRTEFANQEASISALITELKNMKSEFQNMENVRTSLMPDKLASGISKAESQFRILNQDIQISSISSEKLEENIRQIQAILDKPNNGGIINKAEVEQVFTLIKQADSELKALNKEKVGSDSLQVLKVNAEALVNTLSNDKFKGFTTSIQGVETSAQSLIEKLNNIKTASDFKVAKAEVDAYTKAFNEASAAANKMSLNKINLSISNGGNADVAISTLEDKFKKLGLSADEVKSKMSGVYLEMRNLKTAIASGNFSVIETQFEKLNNVIATTQGQYRKLSSEASKYVSEQRRLATANTMEAWLQKNTKATKSAQNQLRQYIDSLRDMNVQITKTDFARMQNGFKSVENSMRGLGKLGASFKDQMREAYESFTQWISISSAVMAVVSSFRGAIVEIKELDNILTEISKTSNLTKQQLEDLGNSAFDAASKYGRTASDYLGAVQSMSQSGFYGEAGEAMANQSLLAQAAGDMTQELADKYILATNAAYKYAGSAEKINAVTDGMNSITNRNSVAFTDMAEAMTEAGSVAANYRVDIQDLSALIGTMEANTKAGGGEVGNAIKSILINLQNVSSKKIVSTLNQANASMTEFVNGAERLRNPIEILRDLAKTFNELDEDDPLRAKILTNIGGKYQANKLAAVLSDMQGYDKMLGDYADGTGSAMEEAEKSANNLTGTVNKFKNAWTELINTFVDKGIITGAINGLTGLVNIMSTLTDTMGAVPSVAFATGIGVIIKNLD